MLIKSPKAKLHMILNARYDMSCENPVVQVQVQIEQNWVQSQSYHMVSELEIEPNSPQR